MQDLHIYVRVSTELQMTEGSGLQNQIDQGCKSCEELKVQSNHSQRRFPFILIR